MFAIQGAGDGCTVLTVEFHQMLKTLADAPFLWRRAPIELFVRQVLGQCLSTKVGIVQLSNDAVGPSWCRSNFFIHPQNYKWTGGREWSEECQKMIVDEHSCRAESELTQMRVAGGLQYRPHRKHASVRVGIVQVWRDREAAKFCGWEDLFCGSPPAVFTRVIPDSPDRPIELF